MNKLLELLRDPQVQALIAAGISAFVGWLNRAKVVEVTKSAAKSALGYFKSKSVKTLKASEDAASDGRLERLHGLCNISDAHPADEEAVKAVKTLFPIVGIKPVV